MLTSAVTACSAPAAIVGTEVMGFAAGAGGASAALQVNYHKKYERSIGKLGKEREKKKLYSGDTYENN